MPLSNSVMDWDKLRIFHAVADAGSFTHAGHELGLSQSAVSRQISALEDALNVPLFHRHARGLKGVEPAGLLAAPVELGEHHQHNRVIAQPLAQGLQRRAALDAGLARGHVHLEQAPGGEERQVRGGRAQLCPVGAGLGGEHFPLRAARRPRRRAQGVGGLEGEKRLRAVERVERAEPLLQVRAEALGGELHVVVARKTATRLRMRAAASLRMSSRSRRSSASFARGALSE